MSTYPGGCSGMSSASSSRETRPTVRSMIALSFCSAKSTRERADNASEPEMLNGSRTGSCVGGGVAPDDSLVVGSDAKAHNPVAALRFGAQRSWGRTCRRASHALSPVSVNKGKMQGFSERA